jgi:hypothetical protein
MRDPNNILQDLASVIAIDGLHRGEQLGERGYIDRFDIAALTYLIAEFIGPLRIPEAFFTDELAGIRLIESSAGAMAALRAISAVLDTPVTEEELAPGFFVPNYIDHVSNWARTPAPGEKQPPSNDVVIGRILRAANHHALNHAA